MKQLYIVVFVVLVGSIAAVAQLRLDVRSLPAPSLTFVMGIADTVGVRVGAAGPNVFWDFRQLRRQGLGTDSVTIQYLLPSEAPPEAVALFPTAQVAVRTGSRFEFFRTEGTMFRSLGEWTPTTSLTSGTANPYDTRPVEITYGGQHIDQYKAVLNSQVQPIIQQRAGTHRIVYDGYGRLRLPNGELDNVARTKTTTNTTDTARFTSPTPRVVITTTDIESYRWSQVSSNVPWVIINFTTVRVSSNGRPVSTIFSREVRFRDTTTSIVGVEEFEDDSKAIYPNPAHNGDNVFLHGISADVVSTGLVDVQGMYADMRFARNGPESVRIVLNGVAPGTYALLLRTTRGVEHRRIVVLP